ncbi:lipase family protein, partial [bacterium]|nr:lipase family protein [bacterium]
MNELPAELTAKIAEEVYALTKYTTLKAAMLYLNSEYGGLFDFAFSDKNMLKGKTGGPAFIKCRTAFGFVLIGKGILEGHVFIMFRGTKYLADWLTNMNVSTSSSSLGMPVHDGFNEAFKSMEPQLINFMGELKNYKVHTVNCIGHSLGGAIATICGEWVRMTYGRGTKIYTFGSPRVGLEAFSSYCTASVGASNIYRAYHKTDIVPCIPTWPFFHTPIPGSGRDYYLPSPGVIPMAEYHGMDKYIDSVRGKSWGS